MKERERRGMERFQHQTEWWGGDLKVGFGESEGVTRNQGGQGESQGDRGSQAESWVIRGRHREPPGVRNKKNRQICWDQESKILAVTAFLDRKMSPTGYFVHMAHVRMSVLPT